MEKTNVNEEVIETARQAWNQVSRLFDAEPTVFRENATEREAFRVFYETFVTQLFEEESE